jgi:hypothetical protein
MAGSHFIAPYRTAEGSAKEAESLGDKQVDKRFWFEPRSWNVIIFSVGSDGRNVIIFSVGSDARCIDNDAEG